MKKHLNMVLAAVAAALLIACNKPEPIETAESLVANSERLQELRARCKADHAKVGDDQCNAVAEATRRRFFGSGGPKHTPAAPAPAASAPAPRD
ncbi:MAG: EexN family lipoprotein [Ramlibacter sp.]|nr:EexN family lipoprotein [Ramlibacter sp.]